MKKIITIIMILAFVNGMAQTDSAKLTAKYIYEDVKSGFTKLVSALQGPAKHTYEVYVIQQKVESYSYLGVMLFLLLVAISLFSVGLKRANFKDEEWNRYATISVIAVPISMSFIITTICFFGCSFYAQLINPEYYAIKEIINQLK